jgi:hypothetical protein
LATKTVTIDTGEWAYPDVTGVTHQVTNAQTFTFELTDGGAAAVSYQQDLAKSVTTTDGLRIHMRPQAENASGTAGSDRRKWGPTADAQDGVAVRNLAGEFVAECPTTGILQYWKPASLTVDNVDAPTTISGVWEDQFGNKFSWTDVTVS